MEMMSESSRLSMANDAASSDLAHTDFEAVGLRNGACSLCPPLDEQRRFAAIVESVEQQKARQQAHLAELNTLFASLQSRKPSGTISEPRWRSSANFDFLRQEFLHVAESASYAELTRLR